MAPFSRATRTLSACETGAAYPSGFPLKNSTMRFCTSTPAYSSNPLVGSEIPYPTNTTGAVTSTEGESRIGR